MRLLILAFVLGVWSLQQQAVLPSPAWALILLLFLPLWWVRRSLLRRTAIMAFGFGAGFFWAAGFAHHRLADALPAAWEGRDVQVVGVVAALPQYTERGVRFEFDIEEVVTPGATTPRHVQLFWFTRRADAEDGAHLDPSRVRAGERWQFVLRLKRPHGTANPHGFDYEAWLLERNLRATGYVRKDPNNFRLAQLVWRPGYLVERGREAIAQHMRRALNGEAYAGVLLALAIGDQHAIPQDQWRVFFRTGVNHLMSISGLHVTLFASLLFVVAQALWRRSAALTQRLPARKAALLFGVAGALAYTLLTGFQVPAQRTLYMLAVVAIAVWFDRLSAPSRVLAWALLAVLLLDPWAVLAPGFWLSFGAVALIFYIATHRIAPPAAWLQAVRVQWAVTLGLVPAMLLLFQQVSLVSPLANAVAIPVVSYLIVPLTLLGGFLPWDWPLHVAHGLMSWAMVLLEWLAQAPAAMWQQHAPPGWAVGVALAGVVWLLAPRGVPARWVGAVLLLPMFAQVPPAPQPGELRLTVLDVGQGLAVVARTANHALVYDAGSRFSSDADAGSRVVLPYLRAAGIKSLDGLIVSHDDNDHAGGALSILDAAAPRWLLSSLPEEHALPGRADQAVRCTAGQRWQWDGVDFEVLYPQPRHYAEMRKDNDRSCVLRIQTGARTVLLPADIEARSERELLTALPEKLRAEVLIVPHHGSRTSSTEAFVAAVQPAYAVFTVGYRNRFKHPKEDVVARYQAVDSQVLRSDEAGAIEFLLSPDHGVQTSTYRKQNPRYWRGS